MQGCDNKMNDDSWKGEKQGNQRGPIHPKKHKEAAEACWESLVQSYAPAEGPPVAWIAELQGMGQALEPHSLAASVSSSVQWSNHTSTLQNHPEGQRSHHFWSIASLD